MTVTNSPKEVSLPKIYFEHWKLTRINYIEIICHIYLRVLFLCGLCGESLISILTGALCGFDDPQTMQTSDDSTFMCALSALPKGFSLWILECNKKNKLS